MGFPIAHSLSPIMHNAALAQMDLDFVYLPFLIQPEALSTAIAGFAAIGVQGFNVTIPHKQAILPLLTQISDVAQAVGAVNTVWRTEQGWSGTNTDVEGFLAPLQAMNRDWQPAIATILGNGGSARAVVAACTQLGCAEIRVVGRDRQKLQAFQQTWLTSPLSPPLTIHAWEELPGLLPQTTLVVNTTPIGMHPQIDQSPIPAEWIAKLPPDAIAYDLIYTPNPTQFLQQASQQGATTIDGLEMLVQQGAAALKIWVKQPVPVEVMRRSLRQALKLE